jgi:hypothetical protein
MATVYKKASVKRNLDEHFVYLAEQIVSDRSKEEVPRVQVEALR